MDNTRFTLVMMPPQSPIRVNWGKRVAEEELGIRVLPPETI